MVVVSVSVSSPGFGSEVVLVTVAVFETIATGPAVTTMSMIVTCEIPDVLMTGSVQVRTGFAKIQLTPSPWTMLCDT